MGVASLRQWISLVGLLPEIEGMAEKEVKRKEQKEFVAGATTLSAATGCCAAALLVFRFFGREILKLSPRSEGVVNI